MRRNWVMAMAAVITVFISTAILGAVLVTRDNLNQGATSLKNRVMIEVFIKDTATPTQVAGARAQDHGPSPTSRATSTSPRSRRCDRFRKRFGERIVANLPINPLPASYQIQVKNADRVDEVAAQFFNDPTVDNDPGTHNGVKYAKETVRKMLGTISLIEKGMWVVTVHLRRRRGPPHQHDGAALHLRAAPRGRDHAPRRRHQLVHPLAVRLRGLHHRPARRHPRRRSSCGSATGVSPTGSRARRSTSSACASISVWWQGGTWPLGLMPTLAILGALLGALGSLVALRRHLRT